MRHMHTHIHTYTHTHIHLQRYKKGWWRNNDQYHNLQLNSISRSYINQVHDNWGFCDCFLLLLLFLVPLSLEGSSPSLRLLSLTLEVELLVSQDGDTILRVNLWECPSVHRDVCHWGGWGCRSLWHPPRRVQILPHPPTRHCVGPHAHGQGGVQSDFVGALGRERSIRWGQARGERCNAKDVGGHGWGDNSSPDPCQAHPACPLLYLCPIEGVLPLPVGSLWGVALLASSPTLIFCICKFTAQ